MMAREDMVNFTDVTTGGREVMKLTHIELCQMPKINGGLVRSKTSSAYSSCVYICHMPFAPFVFWSRARLGHYRARCTRLLRTTWWNRFEPLRVLHRAVIRVHVPTVFVTQGPTAWEYEFRDHSTYMQVNVLLVIQECGRCTYHHWFHLSRADH
ncbi:hypothetical protein BDR05DRAFT_588200 [Suillus weaverae]|nr:hypothetical protein BDR05DRAFT_588200 [Suillus weaverae]